MDTYEILEEFIKDAIKSNIITICGKMRNYNTMVKIKEGFVDTDYIIHLPILNGLEKHTKDELKEIHYDKISQSNNIIVVGDYGDDTIDEINFATLNNISVIYVPEKDIIGNGDIDENN